ncbi:hypothetical protein D3C77_339630 [compost metagenome]
MILKPAGFIIPLSAHYREPTRLVLPKILRSVIRKGSVMLPGSINPWLSENSDCPLLRSFIVNITYKFTESIVN